MAGIRKNNRKQNTSTIIDTVNRIMKELRANADPKYKDEEKRIGINTINAYGVQMPFLRKIARRTGFDQRVADELWKSGIHEAQILASMIYNPDMMEEKQMDRLIDSVDSWDVCDSLCNELFSNTTYADKKISEWVKADKELVKRAGFAMIAYKARRDPDASNSDFRILFNAITTASTDDRNYVKKAVSWALREIGKRNITLNADAIKLAEEIGKLDSQAAQWISKSIISELKSDRVQKSLKERTGHR